MSLRESNPATNHQKQPTQNGGNDEPENRRIKFDGFVLDGSVSALAANKIQRQRPEHSRHSTAGPDQA
jgi:hypothetical protein